MDKRAGVLESQRDQELKITVEVEQKYRHYKGHTYKILAVGRNSETLEIMVVYQGEYLSKEFGLNPVWIRQLKMFEEKVMLNGKEVSRFELIE